MLFLQVFLLSVTCRGLQGGAAPAATVGSGAGVSLVSLGAWLPSLGARWLHVGCASRAGGLKHLQLRGASWQRSGRRRDVRYSPMLMGAGWHGAGPSWIPRSNLVSFGSQGSLWLSVVSPAAERAESQDVTRDPSNKSWWGPPGWFPATKSVAPGTLFSSLQPLPGEHHLCHGPVPSPGATSVALVWDRVLGKRRGAVVLTGSCAFVPLRWA